MIEIADLEIGNKMGFAANGNQSTLLASVTADGANTVTVNDVSKITVGSVIDIVTRATGVVVAAARTVTSLTSAGVLTYSGADVAATVNEGIYPTGGWAPTGASNINGGTAPGAGFSDFGAFRTLQSMKDRLTVLNAGYFTAARLNQMTENDIVYAIRLADAPATVK